MSALHREWINDQAERVTKANADRALDLQIKHQNLPGEWA